MDPNRLTEKTQQGLHDAQTKALRYGHTEVDVEHLLLALLDQPDGLIPRLLDDPDGIPGDVERGLGRRPRVSGAGQGNITVSRTLGLLLDRAGQEAERLRDDYVSVEH